MHSPGFPLTDEDTRLEVSLRRRAGLPSLCSPEKSQRVSHQWFLILTACRETLRDGTGALPGHLRPTRLWQAWSQPTADAGSCLETLLLLSPEEGRGKAFKGRWKETFASIGSGLKLSPITTATILAWTSHGFFNSTSRGARMHFSAWIRVLTFKKGLLLHEIQF